MMPGQGRVCLNLRVLGSYSIAEDLSCWTLLCNSDASRGGGAYKFRRGLRHVSMRSRRYAINGIAPDGPLVAMVVPQRLTLRTSPWRGP